MAQYKTPQKNQLSLDEMLDSEAWKQGHGGKRAGSGRPKSKTVTKVMRVPEELVEQVQKMIDGYKNKLDP
jgi:hypothetical protein